MKRSGAANNNVREVMDVAKNKNKNRQQDAEFASEVAANANAKTAANPPANRSKT